MSRQSRISARNSTINKKLKRAFILMTQEQRQEKRKHKFRRITYDIFSVDGKVISNMDYDKTPRCPR